MFALGESGHRADVQHGVFYEYTASFKHEKGRDRDRALFICTRDGYFKSPSRLPMASGTPRRLLSSPVLENYPGLKPDSWRQTICNLGGDHHETLVSR
jgi:hypothetical protein